MNIIFYNKQEWFEFDRVDLDDCDGIYEQLIAEGLIVKTI